MKRSGVSASSLQLFLPSLSEMHFIAVHYKPGDPGITDGGIYNSLAFAKPNRRVGLILESRRS